MSRVVAIQVENCDSASFKKSLEALNIDDLNRPKKTAVIKVGVFATSTGIHSTVGLIDSLTKAFDKSRKVLIAESDSYGGAALKRLKVWDRVYDARVKPFSLSDDKETRRVKVLNEEIDFSNVLFKPNVFVSTHVTRRYEDAGYKNLMNLGSVLKNLLGLVPDKEKHRFHDQLPKALMDIYEAIGGIDLGVLDSTFTFVGRKKRRKVVQSNIVLAGRDAVAVEAVGIHLVGLNPLDNPLIKEAMKRGLGEGDFEKIEITGRDSVDNARQQIFQSFRSLFPKKTQREMVLP